MHREIEMEIRTHRSRKFLIFNALYSPPFPFISIFFAFFLSLSHLLSFSLFLFLFFLLFPFVFLYITCFKISPNCTSIGIALLCFIVSRHNLFSNLRCKMSWTEIWMISSVRTYVRQWTVGSLK